MNQWTMISMTYERIQGLTAYTGDIKVTLVKQAEDKMEEICKEQVCFQQAEMSEFIQFLHHLLQNQVEPVKVTMIRPIRATWTERTSVAVELSAAEVDILKNNLPRALEMYAPIDRTRGKKENGNGDEHKKQTGLRPQQ